MWIILWQKDRFLLLVHQIGTHSTNDQEEFIQINKKLNVSMKCVRSFMIVLALTGFFVAVVFPVTAKDKHLIFNIGFPFDWKNNELAFWLAYAFVGGGVFFCAVCAIITKMTWYLMISISFEYKILGNQLRHMGTSIRTGIPHLKVSLAAQQQLFNEDLIVAIQTYDKINGYLHVLP